MLKQRLVTAFLLIIVSLWLLFFAESKLWQTAIVVVAAIAAWEWAQFFGAKKALSRLAYAGLVSGAIVLGLIYPSPELLKLLVVLQLAVVVLAVFSYQKTQGKAVINSVLTALFGLIFIVAFSWSMIWLRDEITPWWLLFSMFVIWVMDSGAYFAGKQFGRHKLATYVSPGKTWEGVLGGIVLVALFAAAIGFWFEGPTAQQPGLVVLVVVVSLIAALSVLGDLFESLLKRQVGLKDSGKILPGHGGMLDRIDSLLLAIPLFWLFWIGL